MQKVRLPVEVRILRACVPVDAARRVHVTWNRGASGRVSSDKLKAKKSKPVLEFRRSEACFKVTAIFKKAPDGSWMTDIDN